MTYGAATRYVEGLAILGMRFGLERMHLLLDALGNPHRDIAAIHVVGTNGKSSTCRLAAAALRSQGRRAGTYLSPHVVGWRERIELDQQAISQRRFAEAIAAVRDAADGLGGGPDEGVTQFEVLTAAAFHAFAAAGVDAMVIEAGLGGRYDATNVLAPDATVVLTNVALEHTELLGSTEAEIAAEKLAVVADGSDRLILGAMSARAADAVDAICSARGLRAWRVGTEITVVETSRGVEVRTPDHVYGGLPLALHGAFQRENLGVAIAAVERLVGEGLRVGSLRRAIGAVRMPGRLEVLATAPLIVLDGAHNPAGMEAMAASVSDIVGSRTTVAVVSILGDKDAAAMIGPLGAVCGTLIGTRSSHPRAAAPEVLQHLATLAGMRGVAAEDPFDAVRRAQELAGPGGAVLVCGSLYLLGDLRAALMADETGEADMLAPEIPRKSR